MARVGIRDARLKPCPFCGGAAAWAASIEIDDNEIYCTNLECGVLCMISGPDSDIEKMAAKWNKRAGDGWFSIWALGFIAGVIATLLFLEVLYR